MYRLAVAKDCFCQRRDTVEDDEPDHEPCEEVPASCDSVSTVFPTVDRNIFLLQPRLSYLVT